MKAIGQIRRLSELYRRVEQLREVELHTTGAAVAANVALQRAYRTAHETETGVGRAALSRGESVERVLAEAGCDFIRASLIAQKNAQGRLEQLHQAAVEYHRQSRIERRQLEQLMTSERRAANLEEGRRSQAASDDRFLARRDWLGRQSSPTP